MRNAETLLAIIRKRGQHQLPVKDAYRLLYQRDLYLCAYGKLYRNKGAMTEGITPETVDGMSLEKIDTIIALLRNERYRWKAVRRAYIPKRNGKLRKLGLPTWSDKLLQEVIRMILNAYYEPQFSDSSHGFRPDRGCHTALKAVHNRGVGTKWFVEGDLCQCYDKIDHTILLNILAENFHDNRFTKLISALLKAGYLENWQFNQTFSGVPAGSIVGPILSNIVLDRLDKYVEKQLIPAYTCGQEREINPLYNKLKNRAAIARSKGDWEQAKELRKEMQTMPSRNPIDPNFRRLWYVRYADDFLLGLIGTKEEAEKIRKEIEIYLCNSLKLELNSKKTLITHARDQRANFLGYEIQVIHNNSKHDTKGGRRVNGKIGLLVPDKVRREKCSKYMRHGKPIQLPHRMKDNDYSIVSQYQAEYRGVVQYYRMAYNLGTLAKFQYVIKLSLLKTLASKYKTSCTKIAKRYGTKIKTAEGEYKVLQVKIERTRPQKPLIAYFGGISLRWSKNAKIREGLTKPMLGSRTELVTRLLAQECELCGSRDSIEVHHIHKLADLKQKGRIRKPRWKEQMSERQRKTLVVCYKCHINIHSGKYDGRKLSA